MKTKYTTLSYCAGDPKKTERIIINGHSFNAFANLGHAIRQARYFWKENIAHRELLLWADQACINQSNATERSKQVFMMGDIYSSAEQVLISLSVEGDMAGGIAWLHQFVTICEQRVYDNSSIQHWMTNAERPAERHLAWALFHKTVIESQWWIRAWVRQEYLLSPVAHFMAAFEFVDEYTMYEYFEEIYLNIIPPLEDYLHPSTDPPERCAACRIHRNMNPQRFFEMTWATPINLLTYKAMNDSSGHLPDLLLNLLRHMPHCKASEPKDLVYAFLGISKDRWSYSLQNVFAKFHVISYAVVRTWPFSGIAKECAELGSLVVQTDTDGPSWAPDWQNPPFVNTCPPLTLTHSQFSLLLDEQGRQDRVLRVQGMPLDLMQNSKIYQPSNFHKKQVEEDVQVWVIHGSDRLFSLRKKGLFYVGLVHKPRAGSTEVGYTFVYSDIEELAELVKTKQPSVQTTDIC
jgi:hypothetical protein